MFSYQYKKIAKFVAGFLAAVWLGTWLYWLTFDWYGWLDDWAKLPFTLTAFALAVGVGFVCSRKG